MFTLHAGGPEFHPSTKIRTARCGSLTAAMQAVPFQHEQMATGPLLRKRRTTPP